MAVAFGAHVIDEATTDFLASYNPVARQIRARLRASVSGMCHLVAGCRYTPPFGVTTEPVGRLNVVRNPPR